MQPELLLIGLTVLVVLLACMCAVCEFPNEGINAASESVASMQKQLKEVDQLLVHQRECEAATKQDIAAKQAEYNEARNQGAVKSNPVCVI